VRGVDVTFFGRRTRANPLWRARPAFRLPDPLARAWSACRETLRPRNDDEIAPARDADGSIDIAGTMQIITNVVEGWIREHPSNGLAAARWRRRMTSSYLPV